MYKLQCTCGATCWVRGDHEWDTKALTLDDDSPREWSGGGEVDEYHEHDEDAEVIDHEYEQPLWDDVL